ncbi:hypothetical protein F4694_003414 [Bacillus niacini]|uniref:vWA found in TerF C terminus domain-containing protein n=1 Tax=Neobacillus niacini TaxID=86668 RepID=A0A852THL9_9BACI|nr:hypothetical protein [Neobacillus niacini]
MKTLFCFLLKYYRKLHNQLLLIFIQYSIIMEVRFIDNANFFHIKDIEKVSDEELYNNLLNEFPAWLTEAKTKGIL